MGIKAKLLQMKWIIPSSGKVLEMYKTHVKLLKEEFVMMAGHTIAFFVMMAYCDVALTKNL
jgi:hypothetical protein